MTLIADTSTFAAPLPLLSISQAARKNQQGCLVDFHAGRGDPVADIRVLGQVFPEGASFEYAIAHQCRRKLALPDGAHAVVNTAGAEASLGERKAFALITHKGREPSACRRLYRKCGGHPSYHPFINQSFRSCIKNPC